MNSALRRAVLVAASAATLVPAPLAAQAAPDTTAPQTGERRVPRRLVYSLVGVAVGAGLMAIYGNVGEGASPGTCTSQSCVGAFAMTGGALVGYLIGREYDQLHSLRFRTGAPLEPPSLDVLLLGEPLHLAVRDSVVAVGGGFGVQVFSSGPGGVKSLGRRAMGVRGIEAVELTPGAHAIAVGSPTGLYLYPPASGPGVLLREGRASALAVANQRLWFGVGTRVEGAPVGADSARTWPGVELGGRVTALLGDDSRGLLWALTDSALVGLRLVGDSLERLSTLPLAAPARRLALQGDRLAIALGESGLRMIDARDPAAPRVTSDWHGARYVYDVSLAGDRIYVAAGVEGVYVLSNADDHLTTLGLARELGFATALESRGPYTYMLDRTSRSLRRISSDF